MDSYRISLETDTRLGYYLHYPHKIMKPRSWKSLIIPAAAAKTPKMCENYSCGHGGHNYFGTKRRDKEQSKG